MNDLNSFTIFNNAVVVEEENKNKNKNKNKQVNIGDVEFM
jgi:hypothetical protein